MHSTSVAVSREPRRAKTDRLDTEMLIRVVLGWLRGEPRHCKMVAIPTLEEEDARRPSRERETLVGERTRIINRMKAALVLARVIGVGVETADMLVQEVLSRNLRDRRAVARYAGLTGSPDESGSKRREQGLSKAGNVRVRRGLIQLAWRFLRFQKDSALAQWHRGRTEEVAGKRKRTMIVALARKLLIALWRLVTIGEIPVGVALRTAIA
jgi:transposase